MKEKRNYILFLDRTTEQGVEEIVYRFKEKYMAEIAAINYRRWGWNTVIRHSKPIIPQCRSTQAQSVKN